RGEVVAEFFGLGEKRLIDHAADGMDAQVFFAGFAAAGAVEASHGLAAAHGEGLAEDVTAAGASGCFFGRQQDKCNWIVAANAGMRFIPPLAKLKPRLTFAS